VASRRDRRALEVALEAARGPRARAQACHALAVFHDNNSREAEAIPLYREALALDLPVPTRAQALAWLASSLMKTGSAPEAAERASEARQLTADTALLQFLDGLDRRIARRLRRGG
jgi:hypothetical protein